MSIECYNDNCLHHPGDEPFCVEEDCTDSVALEDLCPHDDEGKHDWRYIKGNEDVSLYRCRNCRREVVE